MKQHLAALRMLFDWLVVGHIIEHNPAHAVRGPNYRPGKNRQSPSECPAGRPRFAETGADNQPLMPHPATRKFDACTAGLPDTRDRLQRH
jgi:hypothetical protein